MRRPIALALVALSLTLACSRGTEVRRAGSTAAAAVPEATIPDALPPRIDSEAVLAPDGSATLGSTRVLVDADTGEVLPPHVVAVLEAGPGGPALPGEVDLIFEEPAHRGRIPIMLSGASVIDLAPMQAVEPPPTPAVPVPSEPAVPAARALDALD